MNYIKAITFKKETAIILIQFIALMGIATVAPLFHGQPITGPIVNATLFTGVMLLGARNAILIGLIPSLIALSVGLLPPVLAPMIPFIMVSNTLLILVFDYLRGRNYWLGVIVASGIKFLFLFTTSTVVINLLLKKEIASKVAMMMSWPQLYTALLGGIFTYGFLKVLKKKKS